MKPDNVEDSLYPRDIDPAQRTEFGTAQSIVPSSFLVEAGAEGMFYFFVGVSLSYISSLI